MAARTPSHLDHSNAQMAKKIRVIAKIRGFAELEAGASVPWISINKPRGDASHSVSITFGDQSTSRKESYNVDFCYDQTDAIHYIFSREVKPLISGIFDGRNATVIACGARGSGKTYTIQGTDEHPGLTVLAMEEILLLAPNYGKSIAISLYEIDHDHVYDLLPPKRQQVFVLKDAHGKIQLKGLSQVAVTSLSEFQKLYGGCSSRKATRKITNEPPNRSHKGLIIHVLSLVEKLDAVVGKMNFVDLSGYEDTRRKSSDGLNLADNTKINKSIYALQNVLYALNANESHIPFRESKLTHMLQDSMGGASKILMVTCLNPSFCQDSVYMMNLASRSWQGSNSVKKSSNSAKPIISSYKSRISGSVSNTAKKQIMPQVHFSSKKENCSTSALNMRKLFDEARPLNCEKASCTNIVPAIESSLQEEEQLNSKIPEVVSLEDSSLLPLNDANSVSMGEASLLAVSTAEETIVPIKDVISHSVGNQEVILSTEMVSTFEGGELVDKENNSSLVNGSESPPVSARLQELSNNLKLLYSSISSHVEMAPTPSCQGIKPKNDASHVQTSTDFAEPKTPDKDMKGDKEIASFCSPWETFHARSSGVKNSLVQEYLRFLNSASKEELKKLKGIGEKRATHILELREESPEPFKELDDLKNVGLSAKQIKSMLGKEVGGLFRE